MSKEDKIRVIENINATMKVEDLELSEETRKLAMKNNYYLNFNQVSAAEILSASIKSVMDTTDLESTVYTRLQKIHND